MSTTRLRARAASAVMVAVGYITRRRLMFHKRGADGSAKADAFCTACDDDRVWGVVFQIAKDEKLALDELEGGYETQQVNVIGEHGRMAASIYVARPEMTADSLLPFDWYHRLVVQGALEHGLPTAYVERLRSISAVGDPDLARGRRNGKLIAR